MLLTAIFSEIATTGRNVCRRYDSESVDGVDGARWRLAHRGTAALFGAPRWRPTGCAAPRDSAIDSSIPCSPVCTPLFAPLHLAPLLARLCTCTRVFGLWPLTRWVCASTPRASNLVHAWRRGHTRARRQSECSFIITLPSPKLKHVRRLVTLTEVVSV